MGESVIVRAPAYYPPSGPLELLQVEIFEFSNWEKRRRTHTLIDGFVKFVRVTIHRNMEHKNFKKCHSRNLDQTDLILDFLSTLDKNKNAGYSWQEEINQINKDWVRMMDGDPGSQDSLDGHHDTPASQYQKNISTSTNQQ